MTCDSKVNLFKVVNLCSVTYAHISSDYREQRLSMKHTEEMLMGTCPHNYLRGFNYICVEIYTI